VQTLKRCHNQLRAVCADTKVKTTNENGSANERDGSYPLLQGNARPHTNLRTRVATISMGLTVLPHPPYSPDLAPFGSHLFGPPEGCAPRTSGRQAETRRA
jgi:hypothetical protein